MKIEDWERIVYSPHKVEWKHTTGVRILLVKQGILYKLFLLDNKGATHFTIQDVNRSKLEAKSADWQRDYNKHLRKITLSSN